MVNLKNGHVNPCVYPIEAFHQNLIQISQLLRVLRLAQLTNCGTPLARYIGEKEGPSGLNNIQAFLDEKV